MTTGWDERILVVAPHADDETLGCGGLLISRDSREHRVLVMSLGKTPPSPGEQTRAEMDLAMQRLGVRGATVAFPGSQGLLDTLPLASLVRVIDQAIDDFRPTSLFVPYASHHQDHQAVYRATLAALRPRASTIGIRLVALYEYPYAASWPPPELPGGKFHLPLSERVLAAKLLTLAAYDSQVGRPGTWLDVARAETWARMRGAEIGVPAAEAFWLVRGLL
jgi:LmbE family N-acetylglucosaminyl deacetylase